MTGVLAGPAHTGPAHTVLAHGVGSRHDLPLSPFYAYAGAFAALLISFLALGLLWSSSRFQGDLAGRPLPAALQRAADAPATRAALRLLGSAAALLFLLHLLLGPDDPDRNPAPGALYVLLWVGLVPASLLLGPVWRLLNPLRALLSLRPPRNPRPVPAAVGIRPAAAGLLLFTWLELVAPNNTSSRALLLALAVHLGVQLTGAARYGDRWFAHADPFEVYSSLLARLSPLGRRADGRLVLRSPFNGLDATPRTPGLVATVCVLLGSTAYDGFSDNPRWITSLQTSPLGPTPTATLGLLSAVTLVAACYGLCAGALRLMNRALSTPLTSFAHSLLPIALGYLVAHYFSLFVTEGPRTVILAGGSDNAPSPAPFLGPGGLATLQVAAIVTGHVLGVVAAHDRSVRLFPADRAVAGQLPLFALMIAYTLGGIGLLIA
ncbi:hypothetical protein DEJ44_06425 [Streptomyces venezuelae]|uniref:hypothetical protein n=1 Tax=Streptomyces venezuelae TaxID=54571 RepID=UPI00123C4471|nr:hypothetical protein [Streptomyces venezuelae]QES05283.1 hypothetical protein DEJ44_06425 [Streptomyces venezuelae]